jgi:hypothetical protein
MSKNLIECVRLIDARTASLFFFNVLALFIILTGSFEQG